MNTSTTAQNTTAQFGVEQRLSPVSETVRLLDWQETFVDRGDGSSDPGEWEADSGFGPWYDISMYFGSDSYGWEVSYDSVKISDHDDPDQAKQSAQAHFEKMARQAFEFAQCSQVTPIYQIMETSDDQGGAKDLWMDVTKEVFDDLKQRCDIRYRIVCASTDTSTLCGGDK